MTTERAIEAVDGRGTYPADIRETAYDLWNTTCQHSYVAVAERLGIPRKTIISWSTRDGWQKRSLEERLDVTPESVRSLTGSLLQVAAKDCSLYFANCASGNREPTRTMTQLCTAICDRAGWSPTHYLPTRHEQAPPKTKTELPNLDTLSAEELRELEATL